MKKILIIFLLFIPSLVSSQVDSITISKSYNNLQWKNFVEKLNTEKGIKIYYNPSHIDNTTIEITEEQNLVSFLSKLLNNHNLYLKTYPPNNIFITKNTPLNYGYVDDFFTKEYNELKRQEQETKKELYMKTRRSYLNTIKTIGTEKLGLGKSKVQFSGKIKYIKDKTTPILGATVYIEELGTGTATDEQGYFKFLLNKGTYNIVVKSLDCKDEAHQIIILSDGHLDLFLEEKYHSLDEVLIVGNTIDNIRGEQMGIERLTTKNIAEIPLILGEKDIVKIALLLPGVQSVGEGSAGFNVRGSPVDHNLFYINQVPIYNTSHLFGFFSAFNSEAVSEFTLMKSNIPSKYGGRLASIFDITARKGNNENISFRGGVSPITGNIMVEGPIKKGKSSFMVSARSTYSNWLLKLVKNPNINTSYFQFGDIITNFSIGLGANDNLNFFTYYSYDTINYASVSKFKYNNIGGSIIWYHKINDNRDMNLSLVHSGYNFNIENREFSLFSYKQSTSSSHSEVKVNFDFKLFDNHSLNFGANSILYHLDRGTHQSIYQERVDEPIILGKEKALESGIFIGDKWEINENLSLNGGLRFNMYNYLGPNSIFSYQDGREKLNKYITDTLLYDNYEIIKSYFGLDYRFGAKYVINDNMSLKTSFDRLHQYIFMLSNTIALSPNDKWKLSDPHLKPLTGDQFSLGFYTNLFDNKLETYVETYYKKVSNLVENKDGADLLINPNPEQNTVAGTLKSYGIELMIKKPRGKFNGWINYTYSRAIVTADQGSTLINFGIPYPANYDKPHSINFVGNYKLGRRVSFSSNIVYSTGRPATFPSTLYYQNDVLIHHYSTRNEFKIPDYFRVDVSLKLEGNLSAKKMFHGTWFLSIYNLTGRHNTYSIYFTSGNNSILGRKISIFAQPIFSLSYNVKFGNYAN